MRTQSIDTSPEAERVLIELIRQAPVAKRFKLVRSLTASAVKLNLQNISKRHPGISTEALAEAFIQSHYDLTPVYQLQVALKQHAMQFTADLLDSTTELAQALVQMAIPYYIKGTIANSLYGMQRGTFCVDIVADISQEQLTMLQKQLTSHYYIDIPTAHDAIFARTSFLGIHIPSLLTIRIFLPQLQTFEQLIWSRVQKHTLLNGKDAVSVISPEDLILTELYNYQAGGKIADDQWNEILGVLKVQSENIDLTYLRHWANTLSITDLLTRLSFDAGLTKA